MLVEASLVTAFFIGLLGGVHCIGMCGGIVGALSLSVPDQRHHSALRWSYLLAYNSGRILSYTLAGALFGGLAWVVVHWSGLHHLQRALQLLAALIMVALGMYLAGWWRALTYIEQAGGVVWKRLEPIGRRFLPITTTRRAFALGMLWGWLPCGMVYSVLVWAIATGSPIDGSLLMLSFGIGTLPNLMAMGLAANSLARLVRNSRIRQLAGFLVILIGGYSMIQWIIQ